MLVMPNGRPTVADFQGWAQTQFGRQATNDELQGFANEAGITDPNNISQDQYQRAQGAATQYAATKGIVPNKNKIAPPPEGGKIIPTTGSGQTVTGVPPAYQAQQFQTSIPNYQQTQFTQFQPNQQNNQQKNALMQQIISNPRTLDQKFQDQLFESQKEQAQSMSQQLGQRRQQDLVSRGFGANGNQNQAQQTELDHQLMQDLLAGRRDISTQAALQNRQDELAALQMSQALQSGDIQAFEAILRGQQAQAQDNQFAGQFGLSKGGFDLSAFNANENARQQQGQSQLGNAQFDFMQKDQDRARLLQEFLGRFGSEMETNKFGENQRQFNSQMLLELLNFMEGQKQFGMSFGENQRQFNNQLGFNWAGQQNNQVNNWLDLFSYLGR